MLSRNVLQIVICAGLLACTQQEPPRDPVVINQPGDPAALADALSELGFAVEDTGTGVTANMEIGPNDPRAICRPIYLRDNFGERTSRGRFVDPDGVVVNAQTTEGGELRVTAVGSYLNRYDNRRTTDACDVSEDFEAQIRSALKDT